MTHPLLEPLPGEAPSPVLICRDQHHTWATTLVMNEQEIDQLLRILADLPEHNSYRSLRHRAADYIGGLNILKSRFQRLRLDMTCESACVPNESQTCREPRFGLYTRIETHFRPLTDEFSRIKDGCYQFLSGLVSLNLI